MNDLATLIFSDAVTLIVGFLLGRAMNWKRKRTAIGDTMIPEIPATGSARSRRLGIAVALLAVVITMQTSYSNYQNQQDTERQNETNMVQATCNAQIGMILEDNSKITGQERERLKERRLEVDKLFREIADALATPDDAPRPQDLAGLLVTYNERAAELERSIDDLNESRTGYVQPNC